MILNLKHILWLFCLCEAVTATGKFWMSKCFSVYLSLFFSHSFLSPPFSLFFPITHLSFFSFPPSLPNPPSFSSSLHLSVIWHGNIQVASVLYSWSAANWLMCQWWITALRFCCYCSESSRLWWTPSGLLPVKPARLYSVVKVTE